MKRTFFLPLCISALSATFSAATAQQSKGDGNKQEEIIIRKHGDADAKMTVEIKDGNVLINGKPLSDFNDSNVTVMKRDRMLRRGNDMFMAPPAGNDFFYKDDNEDEPRPLLGVTTEKNENGAKINDVNKGSAADKAGLAQGDIITRVGDKKITGPDDLVNAIRAYKPNDEVKVYYQRNGKANDTKAVLGERKESIMRSFSFNGDGMDAMDGDMMRNFKLQMPPMPRQPFRNLWMPQNKKLGVKIEDTQDDAGARITTVDEGSAAAKAGLKKDDVITEVDGNKVTNTDEVRDKVMDNEKANYVIKAKRGATEMTFNIKIPKKLNSANL